MPTRQLGLTSEAARHLLDRHGPNALPAAVAESAWHRLRRQFASPLIYVLLFALVLDAALWVGGQHHGVPVEVIAIGLILVLNAWLGVAQERKAEAALARLSTLAAPQVLVWRDGELVRMPSRDLVPGDLVRVEAGDRIPADGEVTDAASLSIDESVVTGESLPVERSVGAQALAGTLVVRGHAHLVIKRTGAASTLGGLATLIGSVKAEPTPLERRLAVFGRRVARWVLVLAVSIAVAGLAVEGVDRFASILLFAVALAVAAVPEGLPAVLTMTLTLGVERMARRKALVRKLAAVEALGSVTVIATDKTGTLTENRLEVHALQATDPERAVRAMILANDAIGAGGIGDPLDVALLTHARAQGHDPTRIRDEVVRESERPFDSAWKFMRVTVREAGGVRSYLKGAPEVLLSACALPAADRDRIARAIEAAASNGYRILALATGPDDGETDLEWLGHVSLWDPPRAEVPDAVRQAQAAGIRVVMITGDHPATALTVARTIGIVAGGALTGAELDALDDRQLQDAVADTAVFARVTPEHKLRLITALQASGEVVAMTGDGVNDAPAIKRADVGVAMGLRGSDVTREVADLVLLDDNFATIVAAVEEGRGIYENIQKFIRFLLSTNLSEVLIVAVAAFAALLLGLRDTDGGLLLALTATQLLWINLVTDGAPALALGLDRNPGVMRRPPRDPKAPLLDRQSLRFVVLSGAIKAAIGGVLLLALPALLAQSVEATRTALFLFMGMAQLLFAYPARHTDLAPVANPTVHLAIAVGAALQALVVFTPWFREAFDTVPLEGEVLLVVAGAALAAWAMAEVVTRLLWPRASTWAQGQGV